MDTTAGDVTILLREWGAGSRDALDRLVPIVYDHLRSAAHARLRNEQARSLITTELVHEAWLRLADLHTARFRDRAHFLAMAARVMRRLLVEHARARRALKRGAGAILVTLDDALLEVPLVSDDEAELVSALDAAFAQLEQLDERQARILEQRYFGGLSLEETAEAAGISLATVKRELRFGRAWLATVLNAQSAA